MTDELTESQRAIIERIANDVLHRAVSRADEATAEVRLPDLSRTRDIAAEEIERWHQEQPPWWDIRRRLNARIAGGSLAIVLFVCVIDYFLEDRALIRSMIHGLIATESSVDARLENVFESWGNGGLTHEPNASLHSAFEQRIDTWSQDQKFSDRSRDAIKALAADDAPELSTLVRSILASQPILMFNGQARLGAITPVKVIDEGCELLVGHWFEHAPGNLPPGLQQVCKVEARLLGDRSLGIPFWAQFHEESAPGRATTDKVYLLMQVQRVPSHILEHDELAEIQATLSIGENEFFEPYEEPMRSNLDGLQIEYYPSNEGDPIDLTSKMVHRGMGFWFGRIDEAVREMTEQPPDGQNLPFELIHSIRISLTDSLSEASESKCTDPVSSAQQESSGCVDNVAQVIAMVMVNKER